MKYDNIQAFEKHIENAAPSHFADIYLVLSKDRFERKAAEEALIKKIRESQKNIQHILFQGDSLEIQAVLTELNTLPFLSERQIVLLQSADKLKAEDKEKLSAYFEHPNRKMTLVLSAESLPANTKFYKKAEKAGIVLDIRATQDSQANRQYVVQWIHQKIQGAGKTIASEAVAFLLQQLGEDRALLDQELEKLICYTGEKPVISVEDIEAVCLKMERENIWKLGEAIFSRNAPLALRIVRSLLEGGAELIPLIRNIRSQVQREYQICSIIHGGGSPAQVTEAFPYMKGMILKKHLQMAETFGIARCKRALIMADETEVDAKNANIHPDLLAERLVLRMTL